MNAREPNDSSNPPAGDSALPAVLVTGGAGFVGSNLAHRLLGTGRRVTVLDNLSRPGVERNLEWLRRTHGERLQFVRADVRDAEAVATAARTAGMVFHFAAQVAVTTSLDDPREDFEVNALGTLNVLEAARRSPLSPGVLMTSTNKVYGGLEDVVLERQGQRWQPREQALRDSGVGEARPLDFHSPYGCSKGAADQYVHDYARSYGLPTVVFRMSCIYGQRQFGTEDQGWVAHFLLRALAGRPLTIFGDGCQVRDILYVDDLVDAFLLAERNLERLQGQAFNIGGGPANTISLLDLLDRIEAMTGSRPPIDRADWRVGDQRYYVSDTSRFQQATGWQPRVDVDQGLLRLMEWLRSLGAAPASERITLPADARAAADDGDAAREPSPIAGPEVALAAGGGAR